MPSSGRPPALRRVAMLSVHTSPLDTPGGGDAGGMNVYIVETAKRLADAGIAVEIFTRATSSDLPQTVEMHPGVLVRHITAGPFEGLGKHDLPGQLCAFSAGVMRAEARQEPGFYDLIHSHYWLSGPGGLVGPRTVGRAAGALRAHPGQGEERPAGRRRRSGAVGAHHRRGAGDRRGRPARSPRPRTRRAISSRRYGADPRIVRTIAPGVDLDGFTPGLRRGRPGAARASTRRRRCCCSSAASSRSRPPTCCCAPPPCSPRRGAAPPAPGGGARRAQRIGAGHAALAARADPRTRRAAAGALRRSRSAARPSPTTTAPPTSPWCRATPSPSGWSPWSRRRAARRSWPLRSAGCRPRSPTATSGLLVDGHDPHVWAKTIGGLLADADERARLARGARPHAERFSWQRTTDELLAAYDEAVGRLRRAGARHERHGRRRSRRHRGRHRRAGAAGRVGSRRTPSPSRCPARSG